MSPSVEPFDEAKYKALMDGLECCEIKFSEAIGAIGDSRWDSEYYKKIFLDTEHLLVSINTQPFNDFSHFIRKGIFDLSPSEYKENGIPFIRTSEIKKPTTCFTSTVFLSNETNRENFKTVLHPYDLVFTKIGAYIGDIAILPNKYQEYNFSQNVAGISLKRKTEGPVLLAFFMSKHGRSQILRSAMLSGQGKLELNDIRNYKVPIFGKDFIDEIFNLYAIIEQTEKKADDLYESAEQKFTSIIPCCISSDLQCSQKQFCEIFQQSCRLDAEYYQPKYDTLFTILRKHNTMPLGGTLGLVSIKKSIEPGSEAYLEEGIPFIRVSDVDKHEISTPPIMLSKDIVPNIEDLYPKKDTILLSKDGSIGIAYKLEKDMEAVTSGALLHLTVKDSNVVLPDYLTLVLNSPIVQLQAERDCNGAVIQHWKPSDIEKVLIPILDASVQQEIASKVQESFRLRAESKCLLDLAVRTVEMAIESDEESALLWLESQK